MKVTIKDIAREAGVSTTTVSLVLNNKANNISQSTINRINKVAEQLNYAPSYMAVGLVTKKTNTIGLILPDISNSYFAETAKYIEYECRKNGYGLILCCADENCAEDLNYIDLLLKQRVDGIILILSHIDKADNKKKMINRINNIGIPVVLLDRWVAGLSCSKVYCNHFKGAYLATKYLIENGHKKIACITGNKNDSTTIERLNGYCHALAESDIQFNHSIIKEGNYKFETGYNQFKFLFEQNITAVFAFNDLMAYGVYKAVREVGKKVPDDISVVGFDDLLFSSMLEVPLTSVKQPTEDLAVQSCKILIDHIRNNSENKISLSIDPVLEIRKSVYKIN